MILMVDVERLLSGFLRAQPEVQAIVGDRVYTELPTRAVPPLLRVSLIGGAPVYSLPLWLDESLVQVDAYGGPKVVARELIDTVRALMSSPQFLTLHPGVGVITCVEHTELAYIPDDGYEPARPRYVASASVYSHPEQEAP